MRKIRQYRDTKLYGPGTPGGKGAGLLTINECDLPQACRLPTHILTTGYYDRYLDQGGDFGPEEATVMADIIEELASGPIGVRSSATDEGGRTGSRSRGGIHAGENLSFMLPNNHSDPAVRLDQLRSAVRHIFDHFRERHGEDEEKMAIVINPIPGIYDDTLAGPYYYPYISGVADSFFPHALKSQDPNEGFARIAFGHGYATVLDDFPVISMATIANPLPLQLMSAGTGQRYFYALNMRKNAELRGEELETMSKLHVRFANFHKIKLLGVQNQIVTIEELVQNDLFGFRTGLRKIMEAIAEGVADHFQIEFVFNIDFGTKPYSNGFFHVVQLTVLPEVAHDRLEIPAAVEHTYLSIANLQGHGVKRGVRRAVVVSPFLYRREMHDRVRARLAEINAGLRQSGEPYMIIVPGRLGCRNLDWGICVDYADVNQAVAIFEFGVDVGGRAEPLPEKDSLTGGLYGSHFLYMIQGGYDEEQKRLQARIFGTQGTHFLTNLMANDVFYGYIAPNQDLCDGWFFAPPDDREALYVLTFPKPVDIYADSSKRSCVVVAPKG